MKKPLRGWIPRAPPSKCQKPLFLSAGGRIQIYLETENPGAEVFLLAELMQTVPTPKAKAEREPRNELNWKA